MKIRTTVGSVTIVHSTLTCVWFISARSPAAWRRVVTSSFARSVCASWTAGGESAGDIFALVPAGCWSLQQVSLRVPNYRNSMLRTVVFPSRRKRALHSPSPSKWSSGCVVVAMRAYCSLAGARCFAAPVASVRVEPWWGLRDLSHRFLPRTPRDRACKGSTITEGIFL